MMTFECATCGRPEGRGHAPPCAYAGTAFDVDVMPDPLTDEAARESDRAAWERAVRDEARRLARDRTFCLAVVVWAHHALTAARTHAADADMAAFSAWRMGRFSERAARVVEWDDAADWLLSVALDARGEAARLARERLALFRDGLLWSDELCNARTPSGAIGLVYEPPGAAARRARKLKGARERALWAIARDAGRRAWDGRDDPEAYDAWDRAAKAAGATGRQRVKLLRECGR